MSDVNLALNSVYLIKLNNRTYKPPHTVTTVSMIVCLFSLALIAGTSPQKSVSARREQVPFSKAIGNGELMHECFPKHPRMRTAR